ncbi:MAG TPA: hypothetical protein DHW34_07110, partial [Actinobacteria bacterium]|nr:hypothetical protein [Actinomycetota bacterium]
MWLAAGMVSRPLCLKARAQDAGIHPRNGESDISRSADIGVQGSDLGAAGGDESQSQGSHQ